MTHCSPPGEAAATVEEVENIDEAMVAGELERAFGENPAASDGEKYLASPGTGDTLSEGVSDNENLQTYYFGSLTITVGKIKEMEEKGYFPEDKAHAPWAKTVLKQNNDEAVVYEDFFVTVLCMPLHLALADILLHFQAQLH
jgi:hypothetical protein